MVGSVFGTIVKWAAKVIAVFARITGGIVAGFRSMLKYIRPISSPTWYTGTMPG